MDEVTMDRALVERYLRRLNVPGGPADLGRLRALVRAHVCRVPFETVSKLYFKKRFGLTALPGPERWLDGVERLNFGGTCYSNNYYFYRLLTSIGYRTMLCGADMRNPDVHIVSIVELDGRRYLVDVGYAAPFTAPLPCDLAEDHVIRFAGDRYVLRPPDSAGCLRLELHRNGELIHGYRVNPRPRRIEEFVAVIERSFRAEATFMSALLLARFCPERSTVIHNLTVTEFQGDRQNVRSAGNMDELGQAILEYFGIPSHVSDEALSGLELTGGAWS